MCLKNEMLKIKLKREKCIKQMHIQKNKDKLISILQENKHTT